MVYSVAQLQGFLRTAGWPEDKIVIMAAIGMAESGGQDSALNPRGEHSVGLWQINLNAHGNRFGTESQLHDPVTNARAALTLYNERQRQGRDGLTHWGAYTDGRYRQYMATSQAAYSGGTRTPVTVDEWANVIDLGLLANVDVPISFDEPPTADFTTAIVGAIALALVVGVVL